MHRNNIFVTAIIVIQIGLTLSWIHKPGPLRGPFLNKDLGCISNGEDPGTPVFVTPYLEKGDYKTAQKLSLVGQLSGVSQQSYAGFFAVDTKFNSNLYFWFFPAKENPSSAPVLLWLQGGPGGSSLFGLFVENGPIGVDVNGKVFERNITWNSKYSMLYIDNPVGTGFSFTEKDEGYATNETQVAENLYNALKQFFIMFPDLKKNDFYMTGESYAGKYIPATAYKILSMTQAGHNDINLKGVAIGDGFSDPPLMVLQYADYLFQLGLLDEMQRDYFQSCSVKAVDLMKQNKWVEAYTLWDSLLNGDITARSYFTNVTGLTDYYNFMRPKSPAEFQYYGSYLTKASTRKAIHVGNLTYNSGDKVEHHLAADVMQSVKPLLAKVMDNYKVLIYSGQLDIIVALPLTQAMLQTVPWSQLEQYKVAPRSIWKVKDTDTDVAGYVRNVKNFYQVVVRGGGHILPYDQPERSLDMIDRFITNRGF